MSAPLPFEAVECVARFTMVTRQGVNTHYLAETLQDVIAKAVYEFAVEHRIFSDNPLVSCEHKGQLTGVAS